MLAALPGCGNDDAAAGPVVTAPTSSAPVTTTSAPAAARSTGDERIAIKDFDYAPGTATVAVGTKVTWKNADLANHTVTFDTGAKRDLGNQPRGTSKSMTFTRAGTFAYHCDYHPNMHGTVVVK